MLVLAFVLSFAVSAFADGNIPIGSRYSCDPTYQTCQSSNQPETSENADSNTVGLQTVSTSETFSGDFTSNLKTSLIYLESLLF